MINMFVFSQNLILDSITKFSHLSNKNEDSTIFVTSQFLFENERELLCRVFSNCVFKTFADYLSDEEMSECDIKSFSSKNMDYEKYINNIRKKKNQIIVEKVLNEYLPDRKYIISKDLGIDYQTWKKHKFKYLPCEYYYKENLSFKFQLKKKLTKISILKKMYHVIKKNNTCTYTSDEVFVGFYNDKKYVFIGNMNRIGYRMAIKFKNSKEECDRLNNGKFESYEKCTYITSWHEHNKCKIPDNPDYAVRWTQDGYLPPNYSHKDYYFKPDNVKYYCWDILGTQLFKNQGLPYEIMPFRKKIYLPKPIFPKKVKRILVVASGSGDWTALKNRSDDDIMVDAIVKMAKKFPDIHFTYRCHPTWVHPQNVGVNSINRVHNYFEWLKLTNLTLSGNIPPMKTASGFKYSFNRSSLEADLKKADFVIGEHSISMIDAAFNQIPFFSVNITNRRNFFIGLNNLGFPSCSSVEEIEQMINSINTDKFKDDFLRAVENYNQMTDMEL